MYVYTTDDGRGQWRARLQFKHDGSLSNFQGWESQKRRSDEGESEPPLRKRKVGKRGIKTVEKLSKGQLLPGQ